MLKGLKDWFHPCRWGFHDWETYAVVSDIPDKHYLGEWARLGITSPEEATRGNWPPADYCVHSDVCLRCGAVRDAEESTGVSGFARSEPLRNVRMLGLLRHRLSCPRRSPTMFECTCGFRCSHNDIRVLEADMAPREVEIATTPAPTEA